MPSPARCWAKDNTMTKQINVSKELQDLEAMTVKELVEMAA